MWSQRSVVDYALARLARLEELLRGSATTTDVCDAHPYLLRAAKFHGEPTSRRCPVCRIAHLTHVAYVYGEELGQYSGRIKQTAELEEMAHQFGEFKVVVVEVCLSCSWNHMILAYLLGDGVKRKPPRRQQTVEDIYG